MPAHPKPLTAADRALWEPSLGLVFPRATTLRPDQVAAPLNVDQRTITRLFMRDGRPGETRRWLMGLEFTAGDKAERDHRRILRDSAILFWADRANYLPSDLLSHFLDVMENRTEPELLAVIARAHEILRRRA